MAYVARHEGGRRNNEAAAIIRKSSNLNIKAINQAWRHQEAVSNISMKIEMAGSSIKYVA